MDDYEKILARTDLRQITSFLLGGTETKLFERGGPIERVLRAQQETDALVMAMVSDAGQQEELLSGLADIYSIMEAAYLELGIRAGLRLLLQ